jgi:hypothetical protein
MSSLTLRSRARRDDEAQMIDLSDLNVGNFLSASISRLSYITGG